MADRMNGTADTRERQINTRPRVAAPKKTGVYTSPIGIEERRAAMGTTPVNKPRALTPQQEADNWLAAYDAYAQQNRPMAGGGGGGGQQAAALQAIATLKNRLNAPSETDALQARLADIYGQAEQRIRQAGAELGASLSTPTPAPQYSQALSVAPTAMSNYLSAIGASGADVSAQQNLSNALLQQIAGNAQQFGAGLGQANESVRQALAGAVPANQLAGISQASLNRAAYEAQLAAQRAKERQAIQDQILEMALKYGVSA